jgi:hypothetical protein
MFQFPVSMPHISLSSPELQSISHESCVVGQGVCEEVVVEREKSVLKQANVQHLYGCLAGTLRPGVIDADLLVRPL